MTQYPAVDLMVKRGTLVAAAIGVLPLLAAAAAVVAGCHWFWLPAGLVASCVTFLLMKTLAELVAIIADMLMPK